MAYTPIQNTQVDADSPVTADLMSQLRDNPIAIANGDAGAPRIVDSALSTTATGAGRDWVLARNAASAAGAVGTYALLRVSGTGGLGFNATIAASSLFPASASGYSDATVLSGTWRSMGVIEAGAASADRVTMFLRVS